MEKMKKSFNTFNKYLEENNKKKRTTTKTREKKKKREHSTKESQHKCRNI